MTYEFDLSGIEAARRAVAGIDDATLRLARGDGTVAKAMLDAGSLQGAAKATSAAEKAMHDALGGFVSIASVTDDSFIGKATQEVAKEHRRFLDGVMGTSGTLADAVGSLKGLRGIDENLFASVKGKFGDFDAARSLLDQELTRSRQDELLRAHDRDTFAVSRPIDLPPIAPNPILKTNTLLDEMIETLDQQRSLIESSAEAQAQETKLIAELVAAFVASQEASDAHARRSQRQAWIGIAVAIASGVIPLVLLLLSQPATR